MAMRYFLSALALALASCQPAFAQTTVNDRLDKARSEVNTAENALGRALYALDRLTEALDAQQAATEPDAGHTMPAAPMGEWLPSPSLEGGAPLVADFPVARGLKPAWGTGGIPDLYNADEGAFRFTCGGEGPLNYDDPLVYPGQPGASHLHKYWGAMEIDAHSSWATLAQVRHSNCNYGPDTLNRSGYWMPALIDAKGQVLNPDLVSVYYKRKTSASPFCQAGSGKAMGICVGLPNRIAFIFGWDSTRPTAKVEGASWYCTGGTGQHYANLDDVFASGCRVGDELIANTIAPNCWDGKHLDAPDHRSHMAYGSYGSWGYYKCPASHPYVIPQEENKASWTVTADMIAADGTSAVRLSSDAMLPGAKPGATLHADYIEAWVTEAKALWIDNCIEKALDCSGGDLGNGQMLIGASQPTYGWINPKPLTAAPVRQASAEHPAVRQSRQARVRLAGEGGNHQLHRANASFCSPRHASSDS